MHRASLPPRPSQSALSLTNASEGRNGFSSEDGRDGLGVSAHADESDPGLICDRSVNEPFCYAEVDAGLLPEPCCVFATWPDQMKDKDIAVLAYQSAPQAVKAHLETLVMQIDQEVKTAQDLLRGNGTCDATLHKVVQLATVEVPEKRLELARVLTDEKRRHAAQEAPLPEAAPEPAQAEKEEPVHA